MLMILTQLRWLKNIMMKWTKIIVGIKFCILISYVKPFVLGLGFENVEDEKRVQHLMNYVEKFLSNNSAIEGT